jgi:hypothetical protein
VDAPAPRASRIRDADREGTRRGEGPLKPLREAFDPTDANEVAAAALLSRVPPLEESIDRKRRVRLALQARSPRRSARLFSPVLVAGILLIAATGASATVTRLWRRSHDWRATDRSTLDAAPHAISKQGPIESKALAEVIPEAPKVSAPEPQAEPISVASRVSVPPKPRVMAHPSAPPPAADPANGPGAGLMVEAMQARRASDPVRASALLAEYQHKYPQGAFQEEALALSIESANARGSESAARLAADYLRRYPNGRFRELAQRVLKSTH